MTKKKAHRQSEGENAREIEAERDCVREKEGVGGECTPLGHLCIHSSWLSAYHIPTRPLVILVKRRTSIIFNIGKTFLTLEHCHGQQIAINTLHKCMMYPCSLA